MGQIVLIYDAKSILISSGKLEDLPVSWRIVTLLLSAWYLGNVICSTLRVRTLLLSFLLRLWCICVEHGIANPVDQEKLVYLYVINYCRVVSQFWCSFITFPLYVIITQVCLEAFSSSGLNQSLLLRLLHSNQYYFAMWLQMGSRFKKTIMSENVRKSLHGWQRRVKARHSGAPFPLLTATSTSSLSSLCPLEDEMDRTDHGASSSKEGSYSILEDTSTPYQPVSLAQSPSFEVSPSNKSPVPLHCDPIHDSYHSDEEEDQKW